MCSSTRVGIAAPLAGLGQLPVARQIVVAEDDARAAAVLDAPQPADVGRVGPHESCIRQIGWPGVTRLQLVLGFGKDAAINWRKPASNRLRVAAAGLGEDEAAAVDVVAQLFGVRQSSSAPGCR